MSKQLRANIILLLAAMIWGAAFVAQSVGNTVGSFTFNGVRSIIGVAALLPVIFIVDSRKPKAERQPWPVLPGILCGIFVTAATTLQQFGLNYTSAGKAGFITALYIILVPIFTPIIAYFFKFRTENAELPAKNARIITAVQTVISLVIATAGMYMLCISGAEGGIGLGDILMFGCAIIFSFQIITVDRVAASVDCIKLSCLQFAVCGVVCTVCGVIFEQPTLPQLGEAWLPLTYAGIMSCGVAYTLQMIGQRHANATVAALIMSLESVFAVLSGWLLLNENLSVRELIGCALMMSAIVLVQLPLAAKLSAKSKA